MPDTIIRWKDLPKYTGLQRSRIAELRASGEFPEPIQLVEGGRAMGWLSGDIEAWQQARKARTQVK
jgi:predicted DNA-binding transcriptional regulator AlpA